MLFIGKLADDAKLDFKVAQMPNADKFQLHIYAVLAQSTKKLGGIRDTTMKRNAAMNKTLPVIIKRLAEPEMAFVEMDIGHQGF